MTSFAAPLSVRVGDRIITKQLADLSFRSSSSGGYTSAQFTLSGDISKHQSEIDSLNQVTISDTRTGQICWQGRLEDPGRAADGQNERWDIVAIGGCGEFQYHNRPVILIDRMLDHWFQMDRVPGSGTEAGSATVPVASSVTPALVASFNQGTVIGLNDRAVMGYGLLRDAGQKLGGFSSQCQSSSNSATWRNQAIVRADWAGGTAMLDQSASTTAAAFSQNTGATTFNTIELRHLWNGGAATVGANEWAAWTSPYVRATLRDRHGGYYTGMSYSAFGYVNANDIIEDMIGRLGLGLDANNCYIDPTSTFQFTQFAYPDGVSAAQIMQDVMSVVPDWYWAVWENGAFEWKPWPTDVRYEVGISDGFSSPQSSSEVYNVCPVRYLDTDGQKKVQIVTSTVPALDALGLTREAPIIDLADEIGSQANALQVGAQFLATHKVPTNGGNVTIARPITDQLTGRRVLPHEIRPGSLIRVRGVESYPDALNPGGADGNTVFRLVGTDYRASEASVQCDLSSPARSIDVLLAELAERRLRKS